MAIRMAETVIFLVILFLALLATIIPVAVQAGLTHLNLTDTEASVNTLAQFLTEHLTLILWTLGVLFVVTGVMMAIHSLIVAGSLRIYIDAERAAGEGKPIDRFYAFRLEAFWEAATDGFWRVFWIYNIAWGVAGLIITLPLMIGMALLVAAGSPGLSLVIMIFLFAGSVLFCMPVGFLTTTWVNRALVDGTRHDLGAREALKAAKAAIRADLATHVSLTFLVVVISLGGVMFVDIIRNAFGISDYLAPLRFIASLAKTFASSLGSAWMLTAFVAVAEEARPRQGT